MSSSDSDNQRLGAFVTNKWLVGTLVLLAMSMGSYIFQGIGRTTDATASQITSLERRMSALEIEVAGANSERRAQYTEIIRRLDRMENQLYIRRGAP